ncbi:unnamed protein product [Parajaminaea phylloscopi]
MNASGSGAGGLRRPGVMRSKLKAPKKFGLDVPPLEMWNRLAHAIGQIQHHNESTLSYEEHYRYAYNLVIVKEGRVLYEGVKRLVEAHLDKQCVERLIPSFPPGGSTAFSADITLPANLPSLNSSSSTHTLGSSGATRVLGAKGKGKARATEPDTDGTVQASHSAEATDVIASAAAGPTSTSVAGDRTDAAVRSQHAERLLKAMKSIWDDHCACMGKLRDVLKYVDKVYVPENNDLPIWDLGLELFRDTVVHSRKYPIAENLYSALLTQIQLERQGQVINRSAVKANIDMLIALTQPRPGASMTSRPTVYKHTFEPAFLATSADFYRAEAVRLLNTTDAKTYLRHVERRLTEEEGRVTVFLAPTTEPSLRVILERHLLADHLEQILAMPGSGLHNMLELNLKEDLRRLYKLFWRIQSSGPQHLKTGLKTYIAKRGSEINASVVVAGAGPGADTPAAQASDKASAASSPQAALALKWVDDVLAFKTTFDDVLKSSFGSDNTIETALNEAFESFINTNPRAPEFISLFIDENLKKGLKGKTEEEVEDTLNRTIIVFRFLHEKDIFERYYKAHLSKRLLQNRSVSDDAERGMMAKLKIECGHQYVQKLQGMLNDMKVSEETSLAFSEQQKKSASSMPFDISVSVLTSTYWPISAQPQPCTMPAEMLSARQAYERFYQSRHSGRVLSWHPSMGSADVKVTFKARKHELNVSTYALVVLLLFEHESADGSATSAGDAGSLSYLTIKSSTNIPDADLKRTLQSLACAKYKILIKEPKGRDVNDDDSFSFNDNFSCPLARIKIATIAARVETQQERKETNERVEEERKNQVEACIVRVMKDRKTMGHNELMNEVVRQLAGRFNPSPALVKKRIESLIDRDYLERNSEEKNVYNYLA